MTHDITLSFSIEEMKAFLEKLGYKKHTVHGWRWEESDDYIRPQKYNCSQVIYINGRFKEETDKELNTYNHHLENVFTKELKAKLLNL